MSSLRQLKEQQGARTALTKLISSFLELSCCAGDEEGAAAAAAQDRLFFSNIRPNPPRIREHKSHHGLQLMLHRRREQGGEGTVSPPARCVAVARSRGTRLPRDKTLGGNQRDEPRHFIPIIMARCGLPRRFNQSKMNI